jgi:hypothetical protein
MTKSPKSSLEKHFLKPSKVTVNLRVVSKSPKPIGGMGYKKGVSDGETEGQISAYPYGQEVRGYDERGD